jgi:hypothetical protein
MAHRRYPAVITAQQAQQAMASYGVRLHIRTLQRWAHKGIAGGFVSRGGRCLYRSGAMVRTFYAD